MAAEPRHDFYQTDTTVIVSVYIKGCKAENVNCSITDSSLSLDITEPSLKASLMISPLFAGVSSTLSSFKVLGSKIEIKLHKADVGIHWTKLKGDQDSMRTAPVVASSTNGTAASRQHSKWDSFKPEEDADDGGVDEFFKKLYADADDDTRRAMMKSYQESGGTSLSTNWSEVGKAKVQTTPPDGMEAKKW